MTKVDGRRARGDVTRRRAARAAADMATLTGLDSISMSKLAQASGSSASGILTVFANREAVQLASVEVAREIFVDHVLTPAWSAEPGIKRLRRILSLWFDYVEGNTFPGGCFFAAASMEYGAQDGPVAVAVRRQRDDWLRVLEGELRVGRRASKKTDALVRETLFELDAYLMAANLRYRLLNDSTELEPARLAVRDLLRTFDQR